MKLLLFLLLGFNVVLIYFANYVECHAITQEANLKLEDLLSHNFANTNLVQHRSRRDLFDLLGGIVSGVTDTVGSVVGGVADTVGNVVTGVANATGTVVSGVANATGEVVSGVADATGGVVNSIANATGVGDLIGSVVDGVTGVVSGVTDTIAGIVSGGLDLITGVISFPEFVAQILELLSSLSFVLLVVEIVFNVFYALGYLFAGNLIAVVVYVVNIVAGLASFS